LWAPEVWAVCGHKSGRGNIFFYQSIRIDKTNTVQLKFFI